MATLIANNGETTIKRIELREGINTMGRSEGNHHVISHGSISGRHCEVVVQDGKISARDLGSTNGTFVEDKVIQKEDLFHGQRLRLGMVEFMIDAPELLAAPRTGALRVNVLKNVSTVETAEAPPVARTASAVIAAINPVIYEEPSFYRGLAHALTYPFNKRGMFLLALGVVFFLIVALAVKFASFFRLSIIGLLLQITLFVFTYGYLFAYMQRIVAASAHGEDDLPEFPDISEFWSDIVVPFLLFTGTFVVSFAPTIAIMVFMQDSDWYWYGIVGTAFIGAFYFPMALLAVAVTDNFLALSPHVVLPSIFRVFIPYLVATMVLGVLVAVRFGMEWALDFVPIPFVPSIIIGFVSLYALVVEMRILGFLFRSYRQRLGWL